MNGGGPAASIQSEEYVELKSWRRGPLSAFACQAQALASRNFAETKLQTVYGGKSRVSGSSKENALLSESKKSLTACLEDSSNGVNSVEPRYSTKVGVVIRKRFIMGLLHKRTQTSSQYVTCLSASYRTARLRGDPRISIVR
jgi:hypothetical protein